MNAQCALTALIFFLASLYWVAFLLLLVKTNKEGTSMVELNGYLMLTATELMRMTGFRIILTACLNAGCPAIKLAIGGLVL